MKKRLVVTALALLSISASSGAQVIAQPDSSPTRVSGQTYFEFQVEKPATLLVGLSKMPQYPTALISSGIRGEVQAQFVVDERGLVEVESFKVLKSTQDLFTKSLRNSLSGLRFDPAMIGGRRVKQLVQLSFQFSL